MQGVFDVVTMKGLTFSEADEGRTITVVEIPEDQAEYVRGYRDQLLETLSDVDSDIMEAYLEGNDVSEETLHRALRLGTLRREILPVFAGSSLKNRGVQPVLDGVVRYLPSPLDVPETPGTSPKDGAVEARKAEAGEPFSGLAFKTTTDRHGELTYVRIYSGVLKVKDQLLNPRTNKKERPSRMFLMHASSRDAIEEAGPGEIVAVLGLKFTATGDTLCDPRKPIVYEEMTFPETVISMALEPKSSADRDKLNEALETMAHDDPTFRTHEDEETGQLIISGMGELHLEIIQMRLRRDFSVETNSGSPRVSYKETVLARAEAEETDQRVLGEKTHFGNATVRVEPNPEELTPVVVNALEPKGPVPHEFVEGMVGQLKGEAMGSGGQAGLPLINVRITLVGAKGAEADMSAMAYNAAASRAFRSAVRAAGTDVLEPIMKVECVVPDDYVGDVMHDLNRRRAQVGDMESKEGMKIIRGTVPLSEMFGYSTAIRSLSQGRASYSMEPYHYQPLDPAKKQQLFGGILA
jgi:elongation factor G